MSIVRSVDILAKFHLLRLIPSCLLHDIVGVPLGLTWRAKRGQVLCTASLITWLIRARREPRRWQNEQLKGNDNRYPAVSLPSPKEPSAGDTERSVNSFITNVR